MRWPTPRYIWTFAEQGGTALEEVFGIHDGTIAGSPSWVKEDYGVAMEFDGSDDLVDFGALGLITGHGPFTWTFYVRLDGNAPAAGYSLYRRQTNDAGTSGAFEIRIGKGTNANRYLRVSTDGTNHHDSTFELNVGWNALTIVLDDTDILYYHDGELKDTQAYTEPTSVGGLDEILGAYNDGGVPSNHFLGAIAGSFFWGGIALPERMIRGMFFDPWRPFLAVPFPKWLTKRILDVPAPGGGAGTGTHDPTAYDPFGVVKGTTLRQVFRDGDLAPVELLDIWLDPTDFAGEPTYSFVSQPLPFKWDGRQYTPLGWRRGPVDMSDDTASDLMKLAITDMDATFASLSQSVQLGGARVEIKQVFAGHLRGGLQRTIFIGKGKEPSFDTGRMIWEIVSYLHLIDTEVPKRQFSRMCQYRFGDGSCGVSLLTHTVTGTAEGTSDALNVIDTTNLTQSDDDHWDGAYIEITEDGHALEGVQRPFWRFYPDESRVRVRWPFPSSVAGLDFKIVRGCKKTKEDCEERFDNLAAYGGFAEVPMAPHVPVGKGR